MRSKRPDPDRLPSVDRDRLADLTGNAQQSFRKARRQAVHCQTTRGVNECSEPFRDQIAQGQTGRHIGAAEHVQNISANAVDSDRIQRGCGACILAFLEYTQLTKRVTGAQNSIGKLGTVPCQAAQADITIGQKVKVVRVVLSLSTIKKRLALVCNQLKQKK